MNVFPVKKTTSEPKIPEYGSKRSVSVSTTAAKHDQLEMNHMIKRLSYSNNKNFKEQEN